MIRILTEDNQPIAVGISELLQRVASRLQQAVKPMQSSLLQLVRQHISQRYPGSQYWTPSKVVPGAVSSNSAEVDVNIAGASRAYHDIVILPRFRKFLTIPLAQEALGKRASDFSNTFILTKENGKSFIAQKQASSAARLLFSLAQRAVQKQDKTLLPSDSTIASKMMAAISRDLSRQGNDNGRK